MSTPRFRIVAGRGIGERNTPAAPSPQPPEVRVKQEERTSNAPSPTPVNQPMAPMSQHRPNYPNQMLEMKPNPASPAVEQPHTPMERRTPQPQQDAAEIVEKCVRFFRTLINLSRDQKTPNKEITIPRVKELVTNVIFGDLPPEDFTRGLQETLNSQAQPHLLPFLRRTIPQLRDALLRGIVKLEGIDIPSEYVEVKMEAKMEQDVKMILPDGSHVQQIASGQINMIPVSIGVPTAGVPQHIPSTVDVEMEEPRVEETEAIHVRALQENALKSALIRPEDVMKKITERMKEACYVEEEVLTLISDAAEYRMREILGELAVLAEHRLENLRMNPNYTPIDDVKSQIRFLENLDRQQFEQNENREKEALIRMSKGKGMAKETIEKAKEMQRADAEAKRNRDANAAAIAALSSKSAKPRWDNVTGTGTSGGHLVRPKTIRINIRDFQALASTDALCGRTNIVHKLALGGGVQTEML